MKLALRFILLLFHIAIATLPFYYIGDFMSQGNNILLIIAAAFVLLGLMTSVIMHVSSFILFIKKQKQ